MRLTELPEATDAYWAVPRNAEERSEWIAANKDIIADAAHRSGLPTDMVAGIAWQEVGGPWGWMDDGVDTVRGLAEDGWLYVTPENLPSQLGGTLDETSFGPIAIQVRQAAKVLGYAPANLTDGQRDTIEASLQDPGQDSFIASEYLAMRKGESGFADVPADEMTREQRQELAARHNGGPSYRMKTTSPSPSPWSTGSLPSRAAPAGPAAGPDALLGDKGYDSNPTATSTVTGGSRPSSPARNHPISRACASSATWWSRPSLCSTTSNASPSDANAAPNSTTPPQEGPIMIVLRALFEVQPCGSGHRILIPDTCAAFDGLYTVFRLIDTVDPLMS
ncbi:hypothetical protein ACFYQ5_09515 [Streptomyces sp. NPDC005794]|uniref:hypothetical protein n=1 Tax=Streptomyces sp. NPDC005794 TaxID=3364733 RepID=UPI0036848A19